MILIISDENEHSTDRVIDWLIFYEARFIRISSRNKINVLKLEITSNKVDNKLITILTDDGVKIIDIEKISSFWFRRSNFEVEHSNNTYFKNSIDFVSRYLSREKFTLKDYIHSKLVEKNHINTLNDVFTNKIYNLELAQKAGLKIPNTLITSSKNELIKFFNDNNYNIIYKSLNLGYLWELNKNIEINLYTQKVELDDFCINGDLFFPTFFQENILKKYEIRTFYLNGKCYSTAIFSQNDERTKLDFRHYNFKKPNRTPRFTLPKKIETSIKLLMDSLSMNCGSLDLIFTIDNTFVFLEINPVGQYEQVSNPGNFYLDKEIAETLIR